MGSPPNILSSPAASPRQARIGTRRRPAPRITLEDNYSLEADRSLEDNGSPEANGNRLPHMSSRGERTYRNRMYSKWA